MRTCVWCGDPLPEPAHKGHRRQEFCKRPKTCRQQFYLWHKKMQEDVAKVSDPYWRIAYSLLVEQYKGIEQLLQRRMNESEKQQQEYEQELARERKRTDWLEKQVQHYQDQIEALRIDFYARLKALGISEQNLKEFNEYWKRQMEPFDGETV